MAMTGLQTHRLPLVTCGLLILNGLVFLLELSLGSDLWLFLRRWGVVSQDIWASLSGDRLDPSATVTLLTALFLHAGWVHLIANMLYLWIFGSRLERAMGSSGLVSIYCLAGVVGGICQIAATPRASVPAIGASGAVAGVIGAYLALHPGATIAALAPRWFYGRPLDVSAMALLLVWMASQLLNGALAVIGAQQAQAIGWWAHLGGFGAGLVVGPLVARLRRRGLYVASGVRVAMREVNGNETVPKKGVRREW